MNTERVGSLRLAAFVSPEAPFNAFLMAVLVFVPPFYAGSKGLGLSTVGLVFGLTKLWDVITDPMFGVLSDRIHTRWGRRRPWLILSAPILCVCTYMIFVPGEEVSVSYFALWMVLLYVGWTIGSVSHIAWAAELSMDYHERSRISAYKQGAALVGTLGLFVTVASIEQLTSASDVTRMRLIATFLLVAFPLTVLLATRSVAEPAQARPMASKEPTTKTRATLLKNAPLRRLLIANLLVGIAGGGTAGMLLFYVENVLQLERWSGFALVPVFFSGLLFLPLFLKLARRYGKHRTLCYALLYQIAISTLYLILPAGNLPLAIGVFVLVGASSAVGTFIPRAMMADVADMGMSDSGIQQTGLFMALLQTSSKLSAALAIGLSYPLLSLVGFNPAPDVANSSEALFGLRLLMFAFPAVGFVVIIMMMWNFPLDEAMQRRLREQLNSSHTPEPS